MTFRVIGHPLNQLANEDLLESPEPAASSNSNNQVSFIADSSINPDSSIDPDMKQMPFWVSVSRKSGFRRLHRRGGCWYRAEVEENAMTMTEARYDAYCTRCFSKPDAGASAASQGEKSDESIGTDDESSSTASESASDGS